MIRSACFEHEGARYEALLEDTIVVVRRAGSGGQTVATAKWDGEHLSRMEPDGVPGALVPFAKAVEAALPSASLWKDAPPHRHLRASNVKARLAQAAQDADLVGEPPSRAMIDLYGRLPIAADAALEDWADAKALLGLVRRGLGALQDGQWIAVPQENKAVAPPGLSTLVAHAVPAQDEDGPREEGKLMERIDDLPHPPDVGTEYLVPCVGHDLLPGGVPVLGSRHADPELGPGAAWPHYHLDVRFLPIEGARAIVALQLPSPSLLALLSGLLVAEDRILAAALGVVVSGEAQPQDRPLRCLRPMPVYPEEPAQVLRAILEPLYREARVDCGRCPHRRLPLASLPVEPGGVRVCRGHGLCWGPDGRLVERRVRRA